ncbi:TonB family protein [Flavobacterium azooxidireducens]|uniref:TonB family protein n=1 Tax=Flavobacterium azooxidireducens TaxID=1871076 RepID=A0ABY4KKB5_9FLAO|nr:energy transducer TonB [Flavobacterium azooxidireducens]UPQ80108.1 TonB family protein [Flavobacterium azooxidireducens]
MRNLDDYPNVKHNGKIYFQLGLLASLIAVYFIIELETPASDLDAFERKQPIDLSEKDYIHDFTIEKEPQKEIAKVEPKPKLTPHKPVVDTFKPIDNSNPEPENVETASPDDTPLENLIPTETPTTSLTADIPTVKKSSYEGYELDELPTFAACSGLKGDAQKVCFNEQMKKYLQRNLQYPETARENNKQGSVYVEFVINSNGSISGVKPANAAKFNDKDLEKEALRVISKLPNLKPGKIKGEPVNVRYTIPITFRLSK